MTGICAIVFIILGFIVSIKGKQKYLIHFTLILVVIAILVVYWDNLKLVEFTEWIINRK